MDGMTKVHAGLSVLLKYLPEGGTLCAEHDEIFAAGPKPENMSLEDVLNLHGLGWNYNANLECWRKYT